MCGAATKANQLDIASKIFARVKQIQKQLFEQWGVLETLTPSEYMQFRDVFGSASGFQSVQYRMVEWSMDFYRPRHMEQRQGCGVAHSALTPEAIHVTDHYAELVRP